MSYWQYMDGPIGLLAVKMLRNLLLSTCNLILLVTLAWELSAHNQLTKACLVMHNLLV